MLDVREMLYHRQIRPDLDRPGQIRHRLDHQVVDLCKRGKR